MIKIFIADKEVQKALSNLAGKGKNMRPAMRNVAGIMHDAVEENFEAQGRPRWKPLKPPTIKQREKKGYWPGKILQRRGELATSITEKINDHSAAVGTNKKYAAIQHLGGKAGKGQKVTIPARPYLKLTDRDFKEIQKAVVEYLKDG